MLAAIIGRLLPLLEHYGELHCPDSAYRHMKNHTDTTHNLSAVQLLIPSELGVYDLRPQGLSFNPKTVAMLSP